MQIQARNAVVRGVSAISLTVNGTRHKLEVEPRVTLLDALREVLGLTGTKKGCAHAQCGACTVLVNGQRILSCMTFAMMHTEDEITTIEGLAQGDKLHPLQQAFIECDAFQCGYCTPGQIVSGLGLMAEGHTNSEREIQLFMSGNTCRCGAYPHIVQAIKKVVKES